MSDAPASIDPASVVDTLDLDAYPLHEPGSAAYRQLVERCRTELGSTGAFDLAGFLRVGATEQAVRQVRPLMDGASFEHRRAHNIYFLAPHDLPGVDPEHRALALMETVNRTVCADQLAGSPLVAAYEWRGVRRFLAATMGLGELYLMADPLARINVMSYRAGEALNWHFDRAEFTTTVLLQQPVAGGHFEFRPGLRSATDPNFDGVAELIAGRDAAVQRRVSAPGTLTVFRGQNTAHRVTPSVGDVDRLIAVLSFYDRPGVTFTSAERRGFYGRA